MRSLEDRWADFVRRPFPKDCKEDVNGVCLVGTDSFAAGCISTFVLEGKLDSARVDALEASRDALLRALPELSGESHAYFSELAALAEVVLKAVAC